MPPRKPASALAGEQHVAARVAFERERLGWSYEQLARAMTRAGCPMNQSAINKIEKGQPRRRITVDELMAFAKVINMGVSELLIDRSIVDDAQAAQLWHAWQEAEEAANEARRRADAAREAFEARTGLPPETVGQVLQAAAGSTAWPEDDRG